MAGLKGLCLLVIFMNVLLIQWRVYLLRKICKVFFFFWIFIELSCCGSVTKKCYSSVILKDSSRVNYGLCCYGNYIKSLTIKCFWNNELLLFVIFLYCYTWELTTVNNHVLKRIVSILYIVGNKIKGCNHIYFFGGEGG